MFKKGRKSPLRWGSPEDGGFLRPCGMEGIWRGRVGDRQFQRERSTGNVTGEGSYWGRPVPGPGRLRVGRNGLEPLVQSLRCHVHIVSVDTWELRYRLVLEKNCPPRSTEDSNVKEERSINSQRGTAVSHYLQFCFTWFENTKWKIPVRNNLWV